MYNESVFMNDRWGDILKLIVFPLRQLELRLTCLRFRHMNLS